MNNRGFTLIEFVLVIILATIVLGVTVSLLSRGWTGITITAMAKKLRSDIQYAQELAMTERATTSFSRPMRTRVIFDTTNEKYDIKIVNDSDGDEIWGEAAETEFARDPSTGGDFTVQLNTGDYKSIVIGSASFSATACTASAVLEFDSMGNPYCVSGGVGGASTKMDSAGTVTISKSGDTATITVTQNSGRVTTQ
ncbi:MAG: hypothetical protein A2X87_08290 [Deltaproteobacteria bacterium GWC2_42_51]|nr:MAG: hypothetical protein A2067_09000 [Deltaproteobacteria bacterium GWB2_42_7]OGP34416.1 MAG: hypothetical protein A2X87_08290 [Deltaproteobacteria bacterium GWC2_42_51]OGQ25070.1 MAG: hypothetical protein A3D29_05185 [Deltaproteobacteria bacterium RIFCSPHIGHO2_02_FULL_42_44]OGQ36791.1 MAG: hypothetical protein A3H47_01645 [Deltaproteobacteria bacterium RIFCSPLOWO2_02_FULL_42_39]OGQ67017.1 MAG: hypothetical protein A3F88_08570 [Deltaproteobacteria bacterium RIFCSPLOWO2_12_FULL_42_16]OGQ739